EEAHLLHPREQEKRCPQTLERPRANRAKRSFAASPQLFVCLPVSAKDRILEVGHAFPSDHRRLNLRQRPSGSWDWPGLLGYHLPLDGAAGWNRNILDCAEARPGSFD